MKGMSYLSRSAVLLVTILLFAFPAQAYFEFNQQADNRRYELGYYQAITGGKFPTGNVPNGTDASGGTLRFIFDERDLVWGDPPLDIDVWHKADGYPEHAGFALTLKIGNVVVYDNNGIEDGSGANFYDYSSDTSEDCRGIWPGVIRGYSMANNWDLIYATYFKLAERTTFDTIIGYFDPTPSEIAEFDPYSPSISYRMNIWSSVQDDPNDNPNSYMPAVTSFTGDVFNTNLMRGDVFQISETGLNLIFPPCLNWPSSPIWRLVLKLRKPLTLPAAVYFFSHDAIVVTPVVIDIKPGSDANMIDLKSKGVVPVAILTTGEFKASSVDTATVALAGASPVFWWLKDVDHDGDMDKLFYFDVQDLMLDENSTEAVLTGFTKNGIPIKGLDAVKIMPRRR
jgi:hypothetical protein